MSPHGSALHWDWDSNLFGAFPVKWSCLVCCRFFVRSWKAVLRPVACDQVRGARGRGQGTETVAKLGGFAPRRAPPPPRQDPRPLKFLAAPDGSPTFSRHLRSASPNSAAMTELWEARDDVLRRP